MCAALCYSSPGPELRHTKGNLARVRYVILRQQTAVSQGYGGYGGKETPGHIPNPEVKLPCADGTALGRVWESRSPPDNLWKGPDAARRGLSAFGSGHERIWELTCSPAACCPARSPRARCRPLLDPGGPWRICPVLALGLGRLTDPVPPPSAAGASPSLGLSRGQPLCVRHEARNIRVTVVRVGQRHFQDVRSRRPSAWSAAPSGDTGVGRTEQGYVVACASRKVFREEGVLVGQASSWRRFGLRSEGLCSCRHPRLRCHSRLPRRKGSLFRRQAEEVGSGRRVADFTGWVEFVLGQWGRNSVVGIGDFMQAW